METQKTHWKKNNDPRYISGEELKFELHGLKDNMVVQIVKFNDSETFDQANNSTVVKTGLFLSDLNGMPIRKPVILNNTNGKFLERAFGSKFLEDWIGKPVVLYAAQDKRHGWVARFKAYYPSAPVQQQQVPAVTNDQIIDALHKIESAESMDQLKVAYMKLEKLVAKHPDVIAAKDKRKLELEGEGGEK